MNEEERKLFVANNPQAAKFVRLFLGSEEFINGTKRYCLWLKDVNPNEIKQSADIFHRVNLVHKQRLQSTRAATQKLAEYPYLFGEIRQPNKNYLAIPEVSSENREYIPIGFLDVTVIASNKLYTISGASNYHFGILTSAAHMTWMRAVCGRLKSDYQYSTGIVYNNFPWPDITPDQEKEIARLAQAVLDARAQFPKSTLADLYDPNTMPPVLRKAHQELHQPTVPSSVSLVLN